MRRKRRNHSPQFKAKVAMAAIKGDKTLAELAKQFDLHQNQISQWKQELTENAGALFGGQTTSAKEQSDEIDKLHAKIGQQAMEIDFLAKALDR